MSQSFKLSITTTEQEIGQDIYHLLQKIKDNVYFYDQFIERLQTKCGLNHFDVDFKELDELEEKLILSIQQMKDVRLMIEGYKQYLDSRNKPPTNEPTKQ